MTTRKEELLQRVFGLSKELGKVDFPLIVKLSTGYDVIPINSSNELDKKFIDILNSILKKFLKTSASTRSRYQGNRVNEVGRSLVLDIDVLAVIYHFRELTLFRIICNLSMAANQ